MAVVFRAGLQARSNANHCSVQQNIQPLHPLCYRVPLIRFYQPSEKGNGRVNHCYSFFPAFRLTCFWARGKNPTKMVKPYKCFQKSRSSETEFNRGHAYCSLSCRDNRTLNCFPLPSLCDIASRSRSSKLRA